MANKYDKDFGNAQIAKSKSNLTTHQPDGSHYGSMSKLRTTRFGVNYNPPPKTDKLTGSFVNESQPSSIDHTTKPE